MATKKPADLALDQDDVGTKFVTMVVIMMTMLATLAMGGALVVQTLRASWVGALNGQVTIEIPAVDTQGNVRDRNTMRTLTEDVMTGVQIDGADIKRIKAVSDAEVAKMIAPWMGQSASSEDLPLPALVGLTFDHSPNEARIAQIADVMQQLDKSIVVETHQAWLTDLRRFSLVLLMAALLMAGATIICSTLTVTGAVRARIAAHHADIDLLHVMGASDDYVGGQFVRLVVKSVGRAALVGTVAGLIALKIGGLVAGELQAAMLPAFHWDIGALLWFAVCPVMVTGLSLLAARFTVLRTLAVMP